MAKYTEKQNKWSQAYNKKAYDDIRLRVPKGDKQIYQDLASRAGKSLNKWILDLMNEERDK